MIAALLPGAGSRGPVSGSGSGAGTVPGFLGGPLQVIEKIKVL